jgi:hypothetical protein
MKVYPLRQLNPGPSDAFTHASIAGPITLRGVQIIPEGATRSVETRVCVIAHIRDGKMDRAREYFDSGSMARQLGLDSAPVAAMYSSLGADAISQSE